MNWHLFTPFGNAVLVWPATLLAATLLARQGRGAFRGAAVWGLSLALASLLVAGSKVAFYGWGTGVHAWNLTCLSGHAVLAIGFWPVLAGLLVPPAYSRWRNAGMVGGLVLGLLVAASRVAVRAHPPSEALAGALLGLLVAWVGVRALRAAYLPFCRNTWVVVAVLVLLWWQGAQLNQAVNTEKWFRELGVALSGHSKPYSRRRWLREGQVLTPVRPLVTPITRPTSRMIDKPPPGGAHTRVEHSLFGHTRSFRVRPDPRAALSRGPDLA